MSPHTTPDTSFEVIRKLLACAVLMNACAEARTTPECARFLTRSRIEFSHYETNKDGRISREEFQPIIDSMAKLAAKERAKHGPLSAPTSFEEVFTDRDRNHDGHLTFEEYTLGECKNGHFDRTPPPLPRD
jgi:EF hand domain-containing protein